MNRPVHITGDPSEVLKMQSKISHVPRRGLPVRLNNADRMEISEISVEGDAIELFQPAQGWAWVTANFSGNGCKPRLVAQEVEIEPTRSSNDSEQSLTWLFRTGNSPIFLKGVSQTDGISCFFSALPSPLVQLLRKTSEKQQFQIADILHAIASERPIDTVRLNAFKKDDRFELFRGSAAVARRLGLFKTEVELLENALKISFSRNVLRLLSYAQANAQDYSRAAKTADKILKADPEIADGKFRHHIAELQAHKALGLELKRIAKQRIRRAPAPSKIAYCLHNSLPFSHGGYAMRSHSLAKSINAKIENLIALARPGFPSDSQKPGRKWEEFSCIDDVDYHFNNSFGRRGRAYGYLAQAADYYEQRFADLGVGIVHAATNFWTALPAAIAACRQGLTFVYEVRSFWTVTREARLEGFADTPMAMRDDALENIVLAISDQVITLNPAMEERLVERGVDKDRITVIPNSVDTDLFQQQDANANLADHYGLEPEDLVIGYMGAIVGYEGIDLLIDAAAPLLSEQSNIKLMIIGIDATKLADPTAVEYTLLTQIKHYGLEGRIQLVERVPPNIAREHYHLFDICVYPRRAYEVCELVSPLKPLEAMATGKTVIGSNVGGLRDMIKDNQTGILFEKENVEDLRDSLKRALNDAALRAQLGNNARHFAERERNWDMAAEKALEVYRASAQDTRNELPKLATLTDQLFA